MSTVSNFGRMRIASVDRSGPKEQHLALVLAALDLLQPLKERRHA